MPGRPSALITGITGQDGSYLAELLLENGYEVHGLVRRSSSERFERIEPFRDRIHLHQADLLDQRSLVDALRAAGPTEIYNLAAMSFVAVSWIQPTLTAEFTGVGVTRMLEAMREVCPDARFYQASSSEMFGKVREVPQTELTPFYPRSPYGVAKVYGHFITVNYRESYDLHATSGILFNHECLSAQDPLVVRENGIVAVKTPSDLVALRDTGPTVQTFTSDGLFELWDGDEFTPVLAMTAVRRRAKDPDHRMFSIEAGGGQVVVTAHHRMLDAERECLRADAVEPGSRLALAGGFPDTPGWTAITPELAELLGLLCADGWVDRDGGTACFTNNDLSLRSRVAELWSRCFLRESTDSVGRSRFSEGGARELNLGTAGGPGLWLREQLYTRTGHKQVPPLILNGESGVRSGFMRGYCSSDDLQGGNGTAFKANSPVLAQGLCWLYYLEGRQASVYAESRDNAPYYRIKLASPARVGMKGTDLHRDPAEVRRVVEVESDAVGDWVFDIETESGVLSAGVGRIVVHNSPRRGLEFVTRKITWHAAAIRLGLVHELHLGNLDSERDWGYAKDYVEAMWMMLQQDVPADYVIATGIAHSVRDCVEIAFDQAGVEVDGHVVIDESLKRPAEVDHLVGDASKAKRELGWEPGTSFEQLIRLMVDADHKLLSASGAPHSLAARAHSDRPGDSSL